MPNTVKEIFFIILIGVCLHSPVDPTADEQIFGFCGQTFVTLGLQREKAGRAGLAIYTSVFFAIILELFIFHTLPSFLSLIGVSIILTSAVWVAVSRSYDCGRAG
jgi:drug/metabolite transporter (DMT)-like permease